MPTIVDLGDPSNPPQVIVDTSTPRLDLSWQPSTVTIPVGVGIPGPAGSINDTFTSGMALGSGRVVVLTGGRLVYADTDVEGQELLPAYLSLTSATASGQPVDVIPLGAHHDGSWTWTPDGVLYVGQTGHLTQTVPSAGAGDFWLRAVGQAIDAQTIFFDPQPGIRLT